MYEFKNPDFIVLDGKLVLSYLEVVHLYNEYKFVYNNQNQASYTQTKIEYYFSDID